MLATLVGARAHASECVKESEQGQTARDKGHLREARKHFVACAAETCTKALRLDCARWLEEVDAALPTVVFGAKDANGADVFDVHVFVDGEPIEGHDQGKAVAIDPGPHTVRFVRTGASSVEQKILLRVGERNRLVFATFEGPPKEKEQPKPPPPEGGGISTGAIIFGGVGVLALGSFGYFAIAGANEKSRLRGTCSPGCTDEDVDTLRSNYIAADVSLAVGVVALGIAAYFLLTDKPAKATSALDGSQRFARTIWK
jgi:hypothetical protein